MDNLQRLLIENNLLKAISAFHDCNDREKRESYVREYFFEFCNKYNINQDEALELLENLLRYKRENTVYKYEHFKDLKSILYPQTEENEKDKLEDEGR